jgi:hypothetical protein
MKIRLAGNSHRPTNTGLIIVIAFSALLYGCNHGNKQDNKSLTVVSPLQLMIGKGDNVFRNVAFGADPKTVKAAEKKMPDEVDTNYISYSFPMDTLHADSVNEEIDSNNYFAIAYNFDQQKLNEIDEDIFLASDSVAAHLAQRFSDYFTDKYGESANASDSKVWSFTKKGQKIKVTLSDQSQEYDYGKLSLVFYCEDY